MELKLTRESICINDVVFDENVEQSVELDCLLPDYCPNIFKVLKCKMVPKITSCQVMGEELTIEGVAHIYIIYCSEETNQIKSFQQKTAFSKTVVLRKKCEQPIVNVTAKTEYVNCRGVNSRRVEIRGAIAIRAKVMGQCEEPVVGDVTGFGMQKQMVQAKADSAHLSGSKQFTIREELELGNDRPAMSSVIYSNACVTLTDKKVIANKLILKGTLLLHYVYAPLEEEEGVQVVEQVIPISQIIDLQGVDEQYQCMVWFDVTNIDLDSRGSSEGSGNIVYTEIAVMAYCECFRTEEYGFLSDVYSTTHNCNLERRTVHNRCSTAITPLPVLCKGMVNSGQETIVQVVDIWCDVLKVEGIPVANGIQLTGELECCVMAVNSEGMPVSIEKTVPIDQRIDYLGGDAAAFELRALVSSVSFRITGDNDIEVQAEVYLSGLAVTDVEVAIVSDVAVEEDDRREAVNTAPLTLYYAEKDERVWDIAKRYNTSITAIMQENDMEQETLEQGGMILIPLAE